MRAQLPVVAIVAAFKNERFDIGGEHFDCAGAIGQAADKAALLKTGHEAADNPALVLDTDGGSDVRQRWRDAATVGLIVGNECQRGALAIGNHCSALGFLAFGKVKIVGREPSF